MHPSVKVQIAPSSVPVTPSWFGEVAVLAHVLTQFGVLDAIQQRARFARARFGLYDTIDFVVVLIGYAVSGEPTLKAFYERLWPFASTFMALFGRNALPCHSTLSRFLAALDQPGVEALRLLFQEDLVARSTFGSPPGGVWDRLGKHWFLVDIDGTKQAARQRALPQTKDLPAPHRRFDRVCAKGYFGRKRGQVGRTRTTVLQPYTHQWLGTFSGPGNGDYRAELRQALQAITVYAAALALPLSQVVVRIDGLYGNTAPVNEILSWKLGVIGRSKQYAWLDLRRPSKPDSNQPLMPRLPIRDQRNRSRSLRLSCRATHPNRACCPSSCRSSSNWCSQACYWSRTQRNRLRALLHDVATSRMYRIRCAAGVSAPWIV